MLEGEKVFLRPLKKEDIELFLKWFNNPEITKNLLFVLPLTREKEEKWINQTNLSENSALFTIEAKATNSNRRVIIGNCGIHGINWTDRDATLGIAIGEKDHHGMGLGTEALALLIRYAFEALNLNRVSSSAISFNTASLKLHKKLGFKLEGRRRKARFREGCYYDEIFFGLLRKEWQKKIR